MSVAELAKSLSLLEQKLLPYLKGDTTVEKLVEKSGLQDVEIRRALMWLGNRKLVEVTTTEQDVVTLGESGELAHRYGLAEFRILRLIKSGKTAQKDIISKDLPLHEVMGSLGILKSLGAVDVVKDKAGLVFSLTEKGKKLLMKEQAEEKLIKKDFPQPLEKFSKSEKELITLLSRRKNMVSVVKEKETHVTITELGKELVGAKIDFSNFEEQLTSEMLKNGSWKDKTFRVYDVESQVPHVSGGRRHPTREACNLIRDVYLNMGFQEMSGPWVETAFWCMDSMWIPQDHPARDAQDTFFLGRKGDLPDKKIVDKVMRAHQDGLDTGSTGHTTKWNKELARELILRTHSTATSFRTLSQIGNTDGKYFYIANVFRNEAVDTTHLAEFLQAEGFVIGDNLTLSDLMGFIKEFYARLGIHKIRFKPTYNPYTESSLEAHYYDEKKDKWYALINSGLFRPESLAPYGITKSVIAWGMGASRVAALLTGKTNLRELVGPTVDFDWIATHTTPQPRLG